MKDEKLTDFEVAYCLAVIGVGCAAYEHVPFYGATPIAMAAMMVLGQLMWRWTRRKS